MNIEINHYDKLFRPIDNWHMLAVAEGFSAFNASAECDYGVDTGTVGQLIYDINMRNVCMTLHPKAPLSAIPCKFFRKLSHSTDPAVINEFKSLIKEFLALNSKTIKARNLIINFQISHSRVPHQYIDATCEVLKAYKGKILKDVVINNTFFP